MDESGTYERRLPGCQPANATLSHASRHARTPPKGRRRSPAPDRKRATLPQSHPPLAVTQPAKPNLVSRGGPKHLPDRRICPSENSPLHSKSEQKRCPPSWPRTATSSRARGTARITHAAQNDKHQGLRMSDAATQPALRFATSRPPTALNRSPRRLPAPWSGLAKHPDGTSPRQGATGTVKIQKKIDRTIYVTTSMNECSTETRTTSELRSHAPQTIEFIDPRQTTPSLTQRKALKQTASNRPASKKDRP